ncbi:MAG: hypothetical protein M3Q97_01535 [Bacteroidota bacterium]|nr:hypothetical protein [Bacteroidota bacterium]
MPLRFLYILTIAVLTACGNGETPGEPVAEEVEEKTIADGTLIIPDSIPPPADTPDVFRPDLIISKMKIGHRQSTEAIIGRDIQTVDEGYLPRAGYLNRIRDQLLTLFFHHGATKNTFHEVRVRFARPEEQEGADIVQLDVAEFSTGSGIHLGMTKQEVVTTLGKGYDERFEGSMSILEYKVSDPDKFPVLKSYRMPAYAAKYIFDEQGLVVMQFGFPYP